MVENPTSPIQFQIEPSANVEAFATSDVGTASVVVKSSVIQPKLLLDGVKVFGAGSSFTLNILVGQRITGTVEFGDIPSSPSDTFAWTVSAGEPFNNYVTTDALGDYVPFAPPNFKEAAWYFAKGNFGSPASGGGGDEVLIRCQVVLRAPDPDITFTVENKVVVYEPKNLGVPALNPNPRYVFGTVQFVPDAFAPNLFALWGLECPAGLTGMTWEGALTRVDFFDQGNDIGDWGWFQVAWIKREWQRTGQGLRKNEYYGEKGLDLHVPYGLQKFPPDSATHCTGDTTGFGTFELDDPLTDWIQMDDEFQVAMMYRPPGSASVWVPIVHPFKWFAKGKATQGTPWTKTGANAGPLPSSGQARVFFEWERLIQNGLDWNPPP